MTIKHMIAAGLIVWATLTMVGVRAANRDPGGAVATIFINGFLIWLIVS